MTWKEMKKLPTCDCAITDLMAWQQHNNIIIEYKPTVPGFYWKGWEWMVYDHLNFKNTATGQCLLEALCNLRYKISKQNKV